MDDISSELIRRGRNSESINSAMSEDLGTEEVVNGVDQITRDTPTKEGKPHTMPGPQDHKVDQPPKQRDASFGAGRSTVEQIFNCIAITAKHLEHQHYHYNNFIDFKKAFDRVWHDGLWKVPIGGNNTNIVLMKALSRSTIPAASYYEQSSRRNRRRQIVVFPHSYSVQVLPPSYRRSSTNSTLPCHLVTGSYSASVLQMTDLMGGGGQQQTRGKIHRLQVSALTAWQSAQKGPRS